MIKTFSVVKVNMHVWDWHLTAYGVLFHRTKYMVGAPVSWFALQIHYNPLFPTGFPSWIRRHVYIETSPGLDIPIYQNDDFLHRGHELRQGSHWTLSYCPLVCTLPSPITRIVTGLYLSILPLNSWCCIFWNMVNFPATDLTKQNERQILLNQLYGNNYVNHSHKYTVIREGIS